MDVDPRAGRLTHFALDMLWQDSPDAALDGGAKYAYGCCPVCCAPCVALADLLAGGELDRWVLAWPDTLSPGTGWWADSGRVDRGWLLRAWSRTDRMGCHEGVEAAERRVAGVLARLRAECGG